MKPLYLVPLQNDIEMAQFFLEVWVGREILIIKSNKRFPDHTNGLLWFQFNTLCTTTAVLGLQGRGEWYKN